MTTDGRCTDSRYSRVKLSTGTTTGGTNGVVVMRSSVVGGMSTVKPPDTSDTSATSGLKLQRTCARHMTVNATQLRAPMWRADLDDALPRCSNMATESDSQDGWRNSYSDVDLEMFPCEVLLFLHGCVRVY